MFTVEEYRRAAKRRLPRIIFDYLEGGADDESGVRHNLAAFGSWELKPHRLADISLRDQSIRFFDKKLPTPLVIGPTGLNSAFWPRGDVALARAAAKCGIPFVLSTASNMSIEEVAAEADGERWFQLYVIDRVVARQHVLRAQAARYSALVLTTDVPVNGFRLRDLKNGLRIPFGYRPRTIADGLMHPRWLWSYLRGDRIELKNFTDNHTMHSPAVLRREMDASIDWEYLKQLRDDWSGKLLIKGILTEDDAKQCLSLGADGVVVSNHGGRQLCDLPTPINVLSHIRNSIPSDAMVLIDGGVRTGSDVVKAIALGASAVMLGRAVLYGLAVSGERGVTEIIEMFKRDIDRTLALIGCTSIAKLDRARIAKRQ